MSGDPKTVCCTPKRNLFICGLALKFCLMPVPKWLQLLHGLSKITGYKAPHEYPKSGDGYYYSFSASLINVA